MYLLLQHSRALAISMQSLWMQQTSRLYLRGQLDQVRLQLTKALTHAEEQEFYMKDAHTQVCGLL